jgi:hypothetical protein
MKPYHIGTRPRPVRRNGRIYLGRELGKQHLKLVPMPPDKRTRSFQASAVIVLIAGAIGLLALAVTWVRELLR